MKELTQEQLDKLPEYKERWMAVGLSTEPINKKKAKKAVLDLYERAGEQPPKQVLFARSPSEAAKMFHELSGERVTVNDFCWGQHEAGSAAFYEFFRKETDVPDIEQIDPFIDLIRECGWCLLYDEVAIVCDRPEHIHFDDQDRLHSMDGPALGWRGGDNQIFAVHDVVVEPYVIMEPEKITVDDIESEDNAEIRRVKVEQYGQERYFADCGAKLIHEDDWGKLFRKEQPGDEPLMFVSVINSSPEPDGSFREYQIRVDPNAYGGCDTAAKAVASTWRNEDGSMMFPDWRDYTDQMQIET